MDKPQTQSRKRARRPVDRAISYQATFATAEGERVLSDLMKEHNMIGSSFSKDPLEMAFKEGERNVVLRILQILKINVEELAKKIESTLKDEESYRN